MKAAGALSRWSSPFAQHHAENRLCIALPFQISFIANIARKRPELKRGKTSRALEKFEGSAHDPLAQTDDEEYEIQSRKLSL
jgi:hypothetical protein